MRSLVWPGLLALVFVAVLVGSPWQDLILGGVALVALGLAVSAVRTLKGSGGWRLIIGGAVLLGFAPAVSEVHRELSSSSAAFSLGDAVAFGGYGLFLLGIRRVLTARTMARQGRVQLDAALITLWVAWVTLALFGARLADQLSGVELLAALSYLPFTLAIVFVLLQLILGSATRARSFVLLALATGSTVASELGFLASSAGSPGSRQFGISAAALALVFLSAAVCDERAGELEQPVLIEARLMTPRQSLLLVGSFAAVVVAAGIAPHSWYTAGLLALIGAVSAVRLYVLLRNRERLVDIERGVRSLVTELMRADSRSAVFEYGGLAVDRILSDRPQVVAEFYEADAGDVWVLAEAARDETGVLQRDSGVDLAAAFVDRSTQRREFRLDGPGPSYGSRVVVPVSRNDDRPVALVVEASPVLTSAEIGQLELIAANIGMALETQALRESAHRERADQRFRALVQDSSDVVLLIDAETSETVLVGPTLQRLLGYDEATYLGGSALRHLHPDDLDTVETVLRHAAQRDQLPPTDVRVRHASGHYHWFSLTVRDLTTDPEISGLLINLTDINERKMAELHMRASEQRYRALVQNSNDVFAMIEDDLNISYVSPNIERMLGYTPGDLVGNNVRGLLTERGALALDDFLRRGEYDVSGQVLELEMRTRTGDARIGEVTLNDSLAQDDPGVMVTVRDVTQRKQLESSLRDKALHDELTGLLNRTTLHHELQTLLQGLGSSEHLGVLHLDIDDFKAINETLGFDAGDRLLIEAGNRLRSGLRSDDAIARLGGDEFAIVVKSRNVSGLLDFADRLLDVFKEPYRISNRAHKIAVSVGLATTDSRRADASRLLESAALALRQAKGDEHRSLIVFQDWMREDATEKFEIAADIPGAIETDQFSVVYQPLLALDNQRVRSVEALLRWNHPERGQVSPGVFIPLAEKTGAVVELGRWVLRQACTQLLRWHQELPGGRGLCMAVNVSARQLEREGEAEVLRQIILDSGIDPHALTLELTESTMVDDADWLRGQLESFRAMGVKIAVDDFGTGAAGLSHLRDVPFDILKIDKSYVDGLGVSDEATQLIAGVIELAHTMRAKTVAEGIETPDQAELLRSFECDYGQGFYLGRPMDPGRLEKWFAQGRDGSVPSLIADDRT